MPCRCDGYEEEDRRKEREKLDAATRAACEAMKAYHALYMMMDKNLPMKILISSESLAWFQQHEAEDAKQREYERQHQYQETLRQVGLSKLTSDERRALGV